MKIRLYLTDNITAGECSLNPEMSHYLCRVLRVRTKAEILLFNADSGEWRGRVIAAHPKQTRITIEEQTREPETTKRLKLYFAPIKKSRISTIFAMATELGVTELQPVKTRFTHNDVGREDKVTRQLIEATEQCERLDVPKLLPLISWHKFCAEQQDSTENLLACVESGSARSMMEIVQQSLSPQQILIGPEGGFSAEEHAILQSWTHCVPITLGTRILRAETAVAAALSQWQLCFGQ